MSWELLVGDCVERMAELDAESIDAVVCDPPYGLEFMGKAWDSFRSDDRDVPGYNGRESGSAGEATTDVAPGEHAARRNRAVAYGGGKRATTSRCEGCGKRDQFRKPHGCPEETNWRTELVDPYSAPPTMLAFQNWVREWALQAIRVLKPGGHLVAFGGTRTYHRLASGLEDAGFEIRDSLHWLYGNGFPKSLDVAKAIDRAAGGERTDVVAVPPVGVEVVEAGPATPEGAAWDGWGTALKPGHEPIVLARKPLAGTVAATVLEHGTGAINIDACRVAFASAADERAAKEPNAHAKWGSGPRENAVFGADKRSRADQGDYDADARFPPNVLLTHSPDCELVGTKRVPTSTGQSLGDPAGHGIYNGSFPRGDGRTVGYADADGMEEVEDWRCVDGCPVAELDAQSGVSRGRQGERQGAADGGYHGGFSGVTPPRPGYSDVGGASRFFPVFRYEPKAGRAEREAGLDDLPEQSFGASSGAQSALARGEEYGTDDDIGLNKTVRRRNVHPTVKPIDLMRWLVRLVAPPGGKVLDPFCGSGSTGIACVLEGFDFVGVEREEQYADIIRARIAWWEAQPRGVSVERALVGERDRQRVATSGQLGLL